MIREIYAKAMAVLMKKPLRLWGISLLCIVLASFAGVGFAGVIAVAFAIELLLEASMEKIYLDAYRTGKEPSCKDLFTAFDKSRILRVLGGMAWMELWIFLWCLIPIVGPIFAIIRTYEYRFTPYILMENEDVKPTEAIKISKQQTMGYKGKMFGAEILVYVIYAVVVGILSALGSIPYLGVLFWLVAVLFCIAFFALCPLFLGIVRAAFYTESKLHPMVNRQQPQPYAPYPPYAPNGQQPNGYAPYPPQQPYPQEPVNNYAPAGYQPAPEQPVYPQPEVVPQPPQEPYAAPIAPEPPAAPQPPATVRCPSCGTELPAEAKFCPACGERL